MALASAPGDLKASDSDVDIEMDRMLKRPATTTLLVAGLTLCISCGGQPSSSRPVRLAGAGSTFAYPLYLKWADAFGKTHSDVQVDYQSLGSGAGIGLVTDGRVDFGATDVPMTDPQMETFRERRGCSVLHVPMALGADVPSHNLPGVNAELKFTARASQAPSSERSRNGTTRN